MEMSICKNNTQKKYISKRTFFRWIQMFMCQCACQTLGPIMKARMPGSLGKISPKTLQHCHHYLGHISQDIHQNCQYHCDLLVKRFHKSHSMTKQVGNNHWEWGSSRNITRYCCSSFPCIIILKISDKLTIALVLFLGEKNFHRIGTESRERWRLLQCHDL